MDKNTNMGSEVHTYPPQNPPPYPGPPTDYPVTSQPQAIPMQTTVIQGTNMVPVIVTNAMGPNSAIVVCVSCGQHITTRVERMPSVRTHLFALLICLIGCWPCACLPYCVESCNNADHYCPNCNSYVGSYRGA
ncbi:lipopolysaccharide-induced tumor necrosis factor-alpha factor homolog [Colias croceus]|uniref:lipopolysaccharide-induced tumor necrosis factor-alpha factor homolog n=1 Tax=Colias crocea TaxID=72248 RepID=UPI001E27E9B5|nr:lipopolysaccharide-induced tumor necrosis factor-alpha factor homolog [Colias croceus]